MCDGGGGESTVTQTVSLPPWLDEFSRETLDIARDVTGRDAPQYEGQRLAGLTGDQMSAIDLVRDNQGIYRPYTAAAGVPGLDILARGGREGFGADKLSQYINPYNQMVLDRSLEKLDEYGARQRNDLQGQMMKAGAYGGSRHGVVEGLQREDQYETASDMILGANQSGYDNAVRNMLADEQMGLAFDQMGLTAGDYFTRLGGMQQQLANQDAAALLDVGNILQDQEQLGLDLTYDDFLREYAHPIDMLNQRIAAGAGVPYGQSTTSTQDTGGGGIMGTIGGLASLAGTVGSFFSSKDLKEREQPVEGEQILAALEDLPVEQWRYKHGVADSRPHVGPYAEDFKAAFGLGDGKSIDAVDAMGVNMAAVQALADKVKRLEKRA